MRAIIVIAVVAVVVALTSHSSPKANSLPICAGIKAQAQFMYDPSPSKIDPQASILPVIDCNY